MPFPLVIVDDFRVPYKTPVHCQCPSSGATAQGEFCERHLPVSLDVTNGHFTAARSLPRPNHPLTVSDLLEAETVTGDVNRLVRATLSGATKTVTLADRNVIDLGAEVQATSLAHVEKA